MKKKFLYVLFYILSFQFISIDVYAQKTDNTFDMSSTHNCVSIQAVVDGRWFLNQDRLRVFVKSGYIINNEEHSGGDRFKIEFIVPFLAIEHEEGAYQIVSIARSSNQINQTINADDRQRLNQDWFEVDVSGIALEDRADVWLGFSIYTEDENGDREIFYVHDRVYIFSDENTTGRDRRLRL